MSQTYVTPKEAGYEESRIIVLDHFLSEQIDKDVLYGASYCMARNGKFFSKNALGRFSNGTMQENSLKTDSIFPIASITKFITATAFFRLVEDGKVRLSQPVSDFIEEFLEPPFHQITLTHLLSHTSGFGVDYGTLPSNGCPNVYECIDKEFSSGGRNWIKASLKSGLYFETGMQWGYSTFGFHILGEIIQRISGEKLTDFIHKNILEPCEMTSSFYTLPIDAISRTTFYNEYQRSRLMEAQESSINKIENKENLWNLIPPGGSGLYSTPEDLVKFGTMLSLGGYYNGTRVIGRKTIEKMTRTYTKEHVKDYCWGQNGVYRRYGLGPDKRFNDDFIYSEDTYGHEGSGRCNLVIDQKEQFVVAYFIPYVKIDLWDAVPLWNTLEIMWSGIL